MYCTCNISGSPAWQRPRPVWLRNRKWRAQGKDLAAESQVEAVQGAYEAAQSQLRSRKQSWPRPGAVRLLANHRALRWRCDSALRQSGALMQAGTTLRRPRRWSGFRMKTFSAGDSGARILCEVHPGGDPVEVRIPSLDKTVHGKVTRFSVDVNGYQNDAHGSRYSQSRQSAGPRRLCGSCADSESERQRACRAAAGNQAARRQDLGVCRRLRTIASKTGRSLWASRRPTTSRLPAACAQGEQVVVSDRSGLKAGELVKPKPVEAAGLRRHAQQSQQ